ncbi:MAG TPA: FKBP-type peptidyl-prolyl cis-trans isomerase [Blastocatellia bacterium]|nr:FKBP-type peptidyl-prolyl cis-trans isomerase [Blastocatellia bacterium]HMY71714.1 FKBP-type peptidyl-prolyl cis-trans isomerase [Blastocatellia bacterium]HMZ21384.1 FKBP-type peptidyl-prolyl cis-trans isomerase [Blastocatellia bacterium]HNG29737.1 FKBP-type peptidyl-prolyl cis-trans isomerase [Blastocatellia bacterium]
MSKPHRFLLSFTVLLMPAAVAGCHHSSSNVATTRPSPTVEATPAPTPDASATPGEMKTSPAGLQYQDLKTGVGPRPLMFQSLKVAYVGRFQDGHVFDKGVIDFNLGKDKMLKGWDWGVGGNSKEGIEPMRVGGKRKLIVPPALGYGDQIYGTIPANSTLTFEIELLRINGGGFGR